MATAMRERVLQVEPSDVSRLVHPAVARLHFGDENLLAHGVFAVRRGSGIAVRIVSVALHLPAPTRPAPLALHIERAGRREVWHRSFGGRALDASFERDRPGEIIEGFGPLRLRYRSRAERGALVLDLRSAFVRIGAVSVDLPRWASPRVRARAWVDGDDGLLHACIVVLAPWGGLLLAYRGYLDEVTSWKG